MIRVLVADDHPLLRKGIVRILSEHEDITVVAEAATAAQTIDLLCSTAVDVVLLDLNMPDRSGFEVLGQLLTWPKRPRVLVLSAHPEDQFGVRVLRAGASGYMNKETAPELLVKAIRRIHSGSRYVSEAVAEQLADTVAPLQQRPAHEQLSPREYQVLRLIAAGQRVSAIAPQLGLSPSTVHTVRQRLLAKLSLASDADVARYAVQHNILS